MKIAITGFSGFIASAISIYSNTGSQTTTEYKNSIGTSFLSEVVLAHNRNTKE